MSHASNPVAPPTAPSPGNGTPRPRKRGRKRTGIALGLVVLTIAGFVLARVIGAVGWHELLARLAAADRGWVAVGALAIAAQYAAWTLRWRIATVAARCSASFGFLYLAVAAAAGINMATPFARVFGGLLRARYLAHRDPLGRDVATLYGAVLFDQLMHAAVMSSLTVTILLAGVFGGGAFGQRTLVVGGLALAAIATLVALGVRSARMPHRLSKVWALRLGQESWLMLAELLARPRTIGLGFAMGLVVVAFQGAAQAAAFHAVGVDPPFAVVVAGVLLGALAGIASGSPGGVGTTEAAMIGIFVSQGVPIADATAASFLYRGTLYLFVVLVGIPAAAALEVALARESDDGPVADAVVVADDAAPIEPR